MDRNFFEHFGIPVSFLPDQSELRKKYLAFSRQHHPDFSAGDDQAYESALLQTSLNNQAYKTLSEPLELIKYTLEVLGEPVSQDDKLPPDFLMDMMEWNEKIMEAGMEDDSAALQGITKEFEALESQFDQEMKSVLQSYENTGNQALLSEIKKSYLQRKYLLRLRESINKFARL